MTAFLNAVYLNPELVETDAAKQEECEAINAKLNPHLEHIMGYHMVSCTTAAAALVS